MSVRRSFKLLVLAIIVISIVSLFATCSQTFAPEDRAGFTLTLPAGSGSRAFSKFDAVATWRISGSNSSTGTDFTKDFPATSQRTVIKYVEPGEWEISVDGLDTGGVRLFYATKNCSLVAGKNELNIVMLKNPLVNSKIAVEGPTFYGSTPGPLLNSGTIAFGDVYSASESLTITVSITNTGNSDLLLWVALTNNDQGFSVPIQPTSPVLPLDDVSFDVIFNPESHGDYTDILTISSNDPDIPEFVLNLSGTYC